VSNNNGVVMFKELKEINLAPSTISILLQQMNYGRMSIPQSKCSEYQPK